jgi:taurine-pyruvate aminotransferase
MFKDDAADPMSYFRDISTFGGCTSGPAAALENMRIIEDEGLLDNTLAMGDADHREPDGADGKHKVIGDVRGKGLFCGAELVADRKPPRSRWTRRRSPGGGRLQRAGRDHRHDQPLGARG